MHQPESLKYTKSLKVVALAALVCFLVSCTAGGSLREADSRFNTGEVEYRFDGLILPNYEPPGSFTDRDREVVKKVIGKMNSFVNNCIKGDKTYDYISNLQHDVIGREAFAYLFDSDGILAANHKTRQTFLSQVDKTLEQCLFEVESKEKWQSALTRVYELSKDKEGNYPKGWFIFFNVVKKNEHSYLYVSAATSVQDQGEKKGVVIMQDIVSGMDITVTGYGDSSNGKLYIEYYQDGLRAYSERKYHEAIGKFLEVKEMNANFNPVYISLSNAYYNTGDESMSRKYAKIAAARIDKMEKVYNEISRYYRMIGTVKAVRIAKKRALAAVNSAE